MRWMPLALTAVAATLSLSALEARAYIPHAATIANRLTHGHGRGLYLIEQDVQFRTNAEPLILRERWIVENGDTMRLTVTSPQAAKGTEAVRFDVVYKNGKRTVTDPGSGIKSISQSPEFIEGFFHVRSGHTFLANLVHARIVPSGFLSDHVKPMKIEQIKHQPEPFVRLGRTAGEVAWIFGDPSPVEGKLNPQAWIEQDAFQLRRLRFPSEAEVAADRYSTYSSVLKLPRERTVTWTGNAGGATADNVVTIRVVSVRSVTASQIGSQLEPSSLSPAIAKAAHLPDLAQVREFYTRFR